MVKHLRLENDETFSQENGETHSLESDEAPTHVARDETFSPASHT